MLVNVNDSLPYRNVATLDGGSTMISIRTEFLTGTGGEWQGQAQVR
jgi:hypothetical protein